jgi:predicted transcriptional regulator
VNVERAKSTRLTRPTPSELGVLRVLWRLGPATVRDVHEALNAREPTGYTTALKFLQIMHGKGLVERDESRRAHVYKARLTQAQAQSQMTSQLVDGVFDGSTSKLVLSALGGSSRTTPEELAQIREMLDRLDGVEK